MNYYVGQMIVLENPTRHVEVMEIDEEKGIMVVRSWLNPETGLKEEPITPG